MAIMSFKEFMNEGRKYRSTMPSWDIVDNLEWGIKTAKRLGGNICVWFGEVPSMVGQYNEDVLFMTKDTDANAKDIIPVQSSVWISKAEKIVNSDDYKQWEKEQK